MRLRPEPFPQTWEQSVDQWLTHLRAAGRMPSTIKTRRVKLWGFVHYLAGKPPENVTRADCEKWMGREGLSAETRKGIRATLTSYFDWCVDHDLRSDNPAIGLPHVAGSKPHPRPCPETGIREALDGLSERDRLMVRLGAELGLRRSEIAKGSGRDVVGPADNALLRVVGKGDKQRLIPLPQDLAVRIRQTGDGWLFPSRNDHGISHLTAGRVGKIVGSALPQSYGTHSLRHRAATQAYLATHDLLAVSTLLGHSSVATTQRYVAMPPEELRKVVSSLRVHA